MNFSVEQNIDQNGYCTFIDRTERQSFFVSWKYLELLERLLGTKKQFLTMREGGEISAVMPFMIKKGSLGKVCNSLPYYGSNAGVLCVDDGKIAPMLKEFNRYAVQNDFVASTIVTSPFEHALGEYDAAAAYDFKDYRIGQVTPLPNEPDDETMLEVYHSKTRNMVRKSLKSGLDIQAEYSDEKMGYLVRTHELNMAAIGGPAKNGQFFKYVKDIFTYGSEYKIYSAELDGEMVAAVLLFYYGKTVEYYTPVITEEYRSLQPLSLLIFQAMKDAVEDGYSWWNWGGTGAGMEGVYRFKSRWGARDMNYYYYTKIYDNEISQAKPEELLAGYPNFYVLPFSALEK